MYEAGFYEILGIEKTANQEDIRKAYKRRALQTHPDRLPGATPEQKAQAEEEFRKVNHAYEILNNPANREKYDKHGRWPPPEPDSFRDRRPHRDHDPFARHFNHHFPHGHSFGPDPFQFRDPFELFADILGSMAMFSAFDGGFDRRIARGRDGDRLGMPSFGGMTSIAIMHTSRNGLGRTAIFSSWAPDVEEIVEDSGSEGSDDSEPSRPPSQGRSRSWFKRSGNKRHPRHEPLPPPPYGYNDQSLPPGFAARGSRSGMNGHGPRHGFDPPVQIPISGPHHGSEGPPIAPPFAHPASPSSAHPRRPGPPGSTPFLSPSSSIRSGHGHKRHFSPPPPPPTGGPHVPRMPPPGSMHNPQHGHIAPPMPFAGAPPAGPPGPVRSSHSGYPRDGPRYNIPINSGSVRDGPYVSPKPDVPRGYAPSDTMAHPHQSASGPAHLGPPREIQFAPPPGPPPSAAHSRSSYWRSGAADGNTRHALKKHNK